MKNIFSISLFMLLVNLSYGQMISGEELLNKAIQYHDPLNN